MAINNAINSKQTLDSSSSPIFTGLTLSSLATFSVPITDGSSNIITDPGFIYSNTVGPALSLISSTGNTFLGLHTSATSGVSSIQMDRQTTGGKSFINFETNGGAGDEWWIGLTNTGSHSFFILDQTNSSSPFSIAQGTGLIALSSLTASQAVVTNGSQQLASLGYGSTNTANTLVERDGSGNFSAGTITASLTGTATTATNANNIATTQVSNNATYYPLLAASSTNSNQAPDLASGLGYNPSTNILSTTGMNLSGLTASQAVVTDGSKNLASLAYTNSNTASTLVERDSSGNFSAGIITATLSGNATTATTATNATNVATLAASTNANFYLLYVASSTNGNQAPELNSNLNYNPATATLNLNGGGGINSNLSIGSSAASLIGTTKSLAFSSSLSAGNYINIGTNGRNIGIVQGGNHFISSGLDYDATASGYKYANGGTQAGCAIELGTSGGFSFRTAPSGSNGSAATVTTQVNISNTGVINVTGLTASNLVVTDPSNNLVSTNTLSNTILGNVTKVTQTILTSATSGTYTTPANVTHLIVEVWGSAGGGAGCSTTSVASGGGSGGGGGGYSRKLITSPLATYSYTIDGGGAGGAAGANPGVAGGTTTFGTSLISITGGAASLAGVASLNLIAGNYAAGGVASGGDININGGCGNPSFILASGASGSGSALGGSGGNSASGGNGAQGRRTQGNGNAGTQPSGGGGGGCVINGGASVSGGNGAPGMIVVTEYYVG